MVLSQKFLRDHILQRHDWKSLFIVLAITDIGIVLPFIVSANLFSLTNLLHLFILTGQIIAFDFIVLILIHLEDFGISVYFSGFILLIAADFLLDYSIVSKTTIFSTYGELLWLLGLLLHLFGILIIWRDTNDNIKSWFRLSNCIKSKLIFGGFAGSIVSFLVFFTVSYAFSIINRMEFLALPIFLMIYSVIVIAIFSYVSQYFETPFKKIVSNINSVMLKNDKQIPLDDNFSITEFIFLQNFIWKAFENQKERLKYESELEQERTQSALKEEQLKNETQEKFRKIVGQMLHDIQSPLSGLRTLIETASSTLPEETRMSMRHAVNSIGDMTTNMFSGYSKKSETEKVEQEDNSEVELLTSLALLQILSAKRFEYQNCTKIKFEEDFEKNANFAFIQINAGDFSRMVSNLINNAVDAVRDKPEGIIRINLSVTPTHVIVFIKDNGNGMPLHIQEMFEQGKSISEGKGDGHHGIGLTQVWDAVKKYAGQIDIYVQENESTEIAFKFPRIKAPTWIASEIKLTKDDLIVIVDDDKSIHDAWESRLQPLMQNFPGIKIKHYVQGLAAIEFLNSLTQEQKQDTILLTDYELLKQNLNGLDIIAATKMPRAILVTSHASGAKMQQSALNIGIKALPKELATVVPILIDKKIIPGSRLVDMVWVEDNVEFRDILIKAYYQHLTIDTYTNPDLFMEEVIKYPLDTRIILDTYYYHEDKKTPYTLDGLVMALRLHKMGFNNLVLLSGDDYSGGLPSYLKFVSKNDDEKKKVLHTI